MNYTRLYNQLIDRAKNRNYRSDEYIEEHHILPRCLGGTDYKSNLVSLYPEEHYTAHLLLVKMYPGNRKLVHAANMMCVSSNVQGRNNKLYGWLRRKLSASLSISQSGVGNSQFGKVWVYSVTEQQSLKISPNELPQYLDAGWVQGRVINFDKELGACVICKKPIAKNLKTCSKKCNSMLRSTGCKLTGREQEFKDLYAKTGSMNKSLKAMGAPGAVSSYFNWAKKLLAGH